MSAANRTVFLHSRSCGSYVLIGNLIKTLFKGKSAASAEASRGRSTEPSRKAEVSRSHWISNPWHAVTILPCPRACPAARSLGRVRYLSGEAPPLPLADCTMNACTCRYRHHQDRRSSPRRDSDVVGARANWAGKERRAVPGRRNTD